MTKCKDCGFFRPGDVNRTGWCSIELPKWLRYIITPMTDNRFTGNDDGCDLGKKREKQEDNQ